MSLGLSPWKGLGGPTLFLIFSLCFLLCDVSGLLYLFLLPCALATRGPNIWGLPDLELDIKTYEPKEIPSYHWLIALGISLQLYELTNTIS
jgi:hypothetical protein